MDTDPQSTSTASVASFPASVEPQNPIAVSINEAAAAVPEKLGVGTDDKLESDMGVRPLADSVEMGNDAFLSQESDDAVKFALAEKREGLDGAGKEHVLEISGLGSEEAVVNPSYVEKVDFTGDYGKTSSSFNLQVEEKGSALGVDKRVTDLEKLDAVNTSPSQPTESSTEFREKVDVLEPLKPEIAVAEGIKETDGKATHSEALVDITEKKIVSKPSEQQSVTVNETDTPQSTGPEEPSQSFQSNGNTDGKSTLVDSVAGGVTFKVSSILATIFLLLYLIMVEKLDCFGRYSELCNVQAVNSDAAGDEKISYEVSNALHSAGNEKPPDSFQSNRSIDGQSTFVDHGTTETASFEVSR